MKSSIQWKIVIIYLCVVIIIMITSGTFIIYNIEERQYEEVESQLKRLADYSEYILEPEKNQENTIIWEDIESKLRPAMAIATNNNNKIYVLDNEGILQIEGDGTNSKGERIRERVVVSALNTKVPAMAQRVHFASSDTGPSIFDYAKPILDEQTGDILYIIYVASDISVLYENIESVMRTLIFASLMGMTIAGFLGLVFARMMTSPIVQLTRSAKRLAEGDYIKIPIQSSDEIGQLTKTFNDMATQLRKTMSITTSEKNKLEKILENMADGVMAFNRQGVLIHANPVSYEVIGDENKDHRFDYIFPNMDIDINFDELISGKKSIIEEKTIASSDKYFNIRFAPYSNEKGEGEGVIVVMHDITKQHKLDCMRKEFVANVSHELRTPLTTVKSYTETLIEGAIDDKETAISFLRVMEKEADRMTMLVQDLLELSRIDNKQIQLNFKVLNLKKLVEETIEAQKIHAEKKSHKLILEADAKEKYYILGDNAKMRQILHNILSNAIKYSIDLGTIKVKMFKNDKVVVQIEDTGIGIPKQDIDRIFERFYRVDKARSRSMGGTGLGLAIAKELVELHKGQIKISSKVGKGTTVTLYFDIVTNH